MTPTVYAALLFQTTAGRTATGAPLHLSLHTTAEGADSAVMTALRAQWDSPRHGLAYSFGPSSDWRPDRLLAEAEAQGYTAEVRELEVHFAPEEPAAGLPVGVLPEAMGTPGDD